MYNLEELKNKTIKEIKQYYFEEVFEKYPNLKKATRRKRYKGFFLKPDHVLLNEDTIAISDGGALTFKIYEYNENKWALQKDEYGREEVIHLPLLSIFALIDEAIEEMQKTEIFDSVETTESWETIIKSHPFGLYNTRAEFLYRYEKTSFPGIYKKEYVHRVCDTYGDRKEFIDKLDTKFVFVKNRFGF